MTASSNISYKVLKDEQEEIEPSSVSNIVPTAHTSEWRIHVGMTYQTVLPSAGYQAHEFRHRNGQPVLPHARYSTLSKGIQETSKTDNRNLRLLRFAFILMGCILTSGLVHVSGRPKIIQDKNLQRLRLWMCMTVSFIICGCLWLWVARRSYRRRDKALAEYVALNQDELSQEYGIELTYRQMPSGRRVFIDGCYVSLQRHISNEPPLPTQTDPEEAILPLPPSSPSTSSDTVVTPDNVDYPPIFLQYAVPGDVTIHETTHHPSVGCDSETWKLIQETYLAHTTIVTPLRHLINATPGSCLFMWFWFGASLQLYFWFCLFCYFVTIGFDRWLAQRYETIAETVTVALQKNRTKNPTLSTTTSTQGLRFQPCPLPDRVGSVYILYDMVVSDEEEEEGMDLPPVV